jgi:hypothetical protein
MAEVAGSSPASSTIQLTYLQQPPSSVPTGPVCPSVRPWPGQTPRPPWFSRHDASTCRMECGASQRSEPGTAPSLPGLASKRPRPRSERGAVRSHACGEGEQLREVGAAVEEKGAGRHGDLCALIAHQRRTAVSGRKRATPWSMSIRTRRYTKPAHLISMRSGARVAKMPHGWDGPTSR